MNATRPLGEVVDAAGAGDSGPIWQLATELSGAIPTPVRREYMVTFDSAGISATGPFIDGVISVDGVHAGPVARRFYRDDQAKLVVSNYALMLEPWAQRHGFATAFARRMEDYYRRSGVDRIVVHATDTIGGYAWAVQGFDWNPDRIDDSIANVVQRLNTVANQVHSQLARRALAEMTVRLVGGRGEVRPFGRLPTPDEIAALTTEDVPDLGKRVMLSSDWHGVKYLR